MFSMKNREIKNMTKRQKEIVKTASELKTINPYVDISFDNSPTSLPIARKSKIEDDRIVAISNRALECLKVREGFHITICSRLFGIRKFATITKHNC